MLDITDPRLKDVIRLEVIDENGRLYRNFGISTIHLSLQDEGTTLKVFLQSDTTATYEDWAAHFNSLETKT